MMIHKQPRPAWWLLYTLMPVMGGLLFLESRASLSAGGLKAVQIGIIFFVYGLVWVWVRANDVSLLHDDRRVFRQHDERHAPETDDRVTSWALDPTFRPSSQLYGSGARRYITGRRINITSNGREIHKCSRNLDRQSRRWRS
jgi:hypothetical protein